MPSRPVIEISGIRKVYGRTVAVDDVSFPANEGEIEHAWGTHDIKEAEQ